MIEADEVYPKLWVGSYPKASLRWYFDTVVLCAEEHQDLDTDIEVIKAPLDDAPLTKQAREIAALAAGRVHRRLKRGKRVLVTCHAGRNRSALVAALAMMSMGVSATRAIEQIRQRRVCLYGHTPLSNVYFEAWLLEIGRKVAH